MTASASVRPSTAIADPDAPTSVLKPNSDGSLTVRSSVASSFQYAGATGGITNATAVQIAAAAGAGVRNYLSALQYCNASATDSEIVILDGSTVIWRGFASGVAGAGPLYGVVPVNFVPPLKGTANTAMSVQMVTTGTATRVSAQGYTAP